MDHEQPQGGIVLSYERHSRQLVELLVLRLRNRVGITQYAHPYEVSFAGARDFLIVLSRADLAGVIKVLRAKASAARAASARVDSFPLIVHIDTSEAIAATPYAALYPGVEIVPIEQDNLTSQPEETLSLTLFRDIMRLLDQRASRV